MGIYGNSLTTTNPPVAPIKAASPREMLVDHKAREMNTSALPMQHEVMIRVGLRTAHQELMAPAPKAG